MNDWSLEHSFTIAWYMDVADSSYIAVCYDCLWLIDHSRVLISLFYDGIGRFPTEFRGLRRDQILNGTMSAGGRRCSCACFAPPGTCSAWINLRPLIGCRASGGGSGGHTELARVIGAVDMPAGGVWIAYIKQDLRASQLVAAMPVTESRVCWFNLRNTTETVSFPQRWTSGDTDWVNRAEFQVWLQAIAGDCSMDADSSVVDNREGNTSDMDLFVPWDAPETVVDVSSASVVPLRDLPDGMGLVGRQKDATESRILQGRYPRRSGCLFREIELMRKVAKIKFRQKHPTPCTFCGTIIKSDMYRHVAHRHLELAKLRQCPVSWCTVWRGTPQDLMDHILDGHNVPGKVRRVRLEKLFPPWTVTQQLHAESLSAQHSGISNDVLLFSEVGLSLVHHYRVHRVGRPHAMFRGKYLAQLRALLPVNTIIPTAGRPSGTACPAVASTTSRTDGLGATPRPPGRRRRQQGQIRDTPARIAPRLTDQDLQMAVGAVVFDCRPALLSCVCFGHLGIDMLAVRSAIPPAKSVVVPPELEQQFGGGGGRICLIILVRSWMLLHY